VANLAVPASRRGSTVTQNVVDPVGREFMFLRERRYELVPLRTGDVHSLYELSANRVIPGFQGRGHLLGFGASALGLVVWAVNVKNVVDALSWTESLFDGLQEFGLIGHRVFCPRSRTASERDHVTARPEAVEVVGPCLHHLSALIQPLRAVIRTSNLVPLGMRKL